jgi:hypothetical protein
MTKYNWEFRPGQQDQQGTTIPFAEEKAEVWTAIRLKDVRA